MTCIGPADVDLGALDHDPLFVMIDELQGEMGIAPFQGLLITPASRLGEGTRYRKVFFLDHLEVFHEPRVIFSAQFMVHFPGCAGQGVE